MNNKSITDLLAEKNKKILEFRQNKEEFCEVKKDLKTLVKAEKLDQKLQDTEKNTELKKMIEFYESFFDDESGNTLKEGMAQLKSHLKEELKIYEGNCKDISKDIKDIQKKLNERNTIAEENENSFFPIIPIHNSIIFRVFLTIISFSICFNLIDLNLDYLNFILSGFALPTVITSIVLFIWDLYRLCNKVIKYYKLGKNIHIICKNYYNLKKKYIIYIKNILK